MRIGDVNAAWKKLHGKDIVAECKFDGDRIQIHKSGTEIHYFSRNFLDHSEYAHAMSDLIVQNILADKCILDGEMLVWDTSLNRFAEFGSNQEIDKAAREGLDSHKQLCYVAFDVLYVGDTSVIHQSLKERHELLRKVVKPLKGRLEVLVPEGGLFIVLQIESTIPPSDKIGVASVQGEVEEIIPMRVMKMDWFPYIPLEKRDRQVDKMDFQIFILGCTQRRSAHKLLKEDCVKEFNYCFPYINNPFKEDESEQSTVVQIMFPSKPPVVCEYDWAIDNLEELTDDLIKKETLLMDQKDEFYEFVKGKSDKAKTAYEEVKQAREKAKEGMSEETKEAYKEMKLYKFYPLPSPDTPDVAGIDKSSFINKYLGKAHEVF